MTSSRFKRSPGKRVYRSYKYFDSDHFKIALQEKLKHLENDTHSLFNSAFTNLLNAHHHRKRKHLDTTMKRL